MYRKTQQPPAGSLTRRDKRGIAIVGALVLAVSAGLGIWAAVRPGGYGQSRDGCVTVTVPSSTGGGLPHECRAGATAMMHPPFTHDHKIVPPTRPPFPPPLLRPTPAPLPPSPTPDHEAHWPRRRR